MEIYTKEDFKQIFIDLGIDKGSKILLEADLLASSPLLLGLIAISIVGNGNMLSIAL